MKLDDHPLYTHEESVRIVTEWLLEHGHTVLQMFQTSHDEREHSLWLLSVLDPDRRFRTVLSLGCGVAGMEAHWKAARPELEFELVNISQVQLDLARCDGRKIRANAEHYRSDASLPFDIVVISYLLGHVDIEATLKSALANLAPNGGRLLIYDVFDGTEQFDRDMHYETPSIPELIRFGLNHDLRLRTLIKGGIPPGAFIQKHASWVVDEVTPALFVFEKAFEKAS